MSEEKSSPSLFEKTKNLAGFSWEVIKYVHENQGQALFVDDEVYKERVTTCRGCDKYNEMENSCMECGCYIPAKAKIILDSCPLDKWKEDRDAWNERFEEIAKELDNTEESM